MIKFLNTRLDSLRIRFAEKYKNLIFHKNFKKLLNKNFKSINIIYFINELFENDIISLKTFFEVDFRKFDLQITFYISENIKKDFHAYIENYLILPSKVSFNYFKDIPSFQKVTDSATECNSDFIAFASSQLVFHPYWLQKSFEAGAEAFINEKELKIVGFSSFNPNDFKLLKTLSKGNLNNYCIKDGFSFHSIIFPKFILKEIVSKLKRPFSESDFYKVFFNSVMGFSFTNQSYAEVHSYDTYNIFDSFHEKPNNLSFASQRAKDGWNKELTSCLPKFERLVIHVNYGGLGDNLFQSHLPRIAKETGAYKKVYISNKSIFRHPDYKRLIWEMNPYIDGFTDEMGYFIIFLKFGEEINILDKIMLLNGLDDGERFHEPEMYFKPALKPALNDKIIYDPNFISDIAKINERRVDNYFKSNNIKIDYQMKIRDNNMPIPHFSEWLESKSLEEFCSIIVSCKDIYCLTTGTATLAPALGKKAIVFYSEDYNETFLHSKINQYIKLVE